MTLTSADLRGLIPRFDAQRQIELVQATERSKLERLRTLVGDTFGQDAGGQLQMQFAMRRVPAISQERDTPTAVIVVDGTENLLCYHKPSDGSYPRWMLNGEHLMDYSARGGRDQFAQLAEVLMQTSTPQQPAPNPAPAPAPVPAPAPAPVPAPGGETEG